jgi:hypothetical protein
MVVWYTIQQQQQQQQQQQRAVTLVCELGSAEGHTSNGIIYQHNNCHTLRVPPRT